MELLQIMEVLLGVHPMVLQDPKLVLQLAIIRPQLSYLLQLPIVIIDAFPRVGHKLAANIEEYLQMDLPQAVIDAAMTHPYLPVTMPYLLPLQLLRVGAIEVKELRLQLVQQRQCFAKSHQVHHSLESIAHPTQRMDMWVVALVDWRMMMTLPINS